MLALVAITVLAIESGRRRNVAIVAATFAGSLAVLWLARGRRIDDVGEFIGGAWT